jgi:MoaA/NifB/PqqE/SkfB family radical SAM enzyme
MPDVIVPTVENLCRKLPGIMVRMVLSIDAVGENHDQIRAVPGIFDLAIETFRGLRVLSEKHANLTVNIVSVLSYFNRDTIGETIRYFHEKVKPDQHMVMLTHGDPRDERATDVPIEEYERVVEALLRSGRDEAREYPLDELGSVLARELYRVVAATCRQRRQVIPCVAGQKQIMVDDEGVVYPCAILTPFLRQHPTNALSSAEMGRLRESDYSIPDILRSPQAIAIRRFIAAGGCFCASECFLSPSLLLNPGMFPRLAWATLRQMCKRSTSA